MSMASFEFVQNSSSINTLGFFVATSANFLNINIANFSNSCQLDETNPVITINYVLKFDFVYQINYLSRVKFLRTQNLINKLRILPLSNVISKGSRAGNSYKSSLLQRNTILSYYVSLLSLQIEINIFETNLF